jgi:hypothetical protein
MLESIEGQGDFHVPVPFSSGFLYGFRVHPQGGQVHFLWFSNFNEAAKLLQIDLLCCSST